MKLPKNFEDIDGMGDRSQSATPWHPIGSARTSAAPGPYVNPDGIIRASAGPTNPNPPITPTSGRRGDYNPDVPIVNSGRMTQQPCEGGGDCPPGQSCVGGRCAITTRTTAGEPWTHGGVGTWTPFDGGAVKKNWVPLVVLGMSLAVGIGS